MNPLWFTVFLANSLTSEAFLNSLNECYGHIRSLKLCASWDPSIFTIDRRHLINSIGIISTISWASVASSEIPEQRVVFVAGATGRSGQAVVEALYKMQQQQKVRVGVVGGVRNSNATLPHYVDSVIGINLQDLDAREKMTEALEREKVTDIICTIGFKPTYITSVDRVNAEAIDYRATVTLVKAAEMMEKPPRFLLISSLLTTAPEPRTTSYRLLNSLGEVLEQKKKAEAFLSSSKITYIILRPGVFVEQRQGNLIFAPKDRFIGDSVLDGRDLGPPVQCASPFFSSTGAVCGITRTQLGDAAVSLLFNKGGMLQENRTVEVVARPDLLSNKFI